MIRRDGGRLAGIDHPGALPVPLKLPANGSPFGRVELWPDAVVGVWKAPNTVPTIRVWSCDPSTDRWQAEMGQWRASASTADRFEWLAADGYPAPPGIATGIAVNDETNLATLLKTWFNTLSERQSAVPVLRPSPRPMTSRTRWAIAASLCLLAAAGCAAHWHFTEKQVDTVEAQTADNTAQLTRLTEMGRQVEEKTKDRDKRRGERAKRERAAYTLEAHRTRFAQLLKLLSETKPADLVIQSIENDGGTTKIVGMTLRPELADNFAQSLHGPLHQLGWEVQPASELAQPQRSAESDGLWRFELLVRNVTETKQAVPTAIRRRD